MRKIRSTKWLACITTIAGSVLVSGCQDEDGPITPHERQIHISHAASDNNTMLQTSHEVLDITGAALQEQGLSSTGHVAEGRIMHDDYTWTCKPSISGSFHLDRSSPDSTIYTGSVTVDFGDGSSCPDTERVRKGKITDEFQLIFVHGDSVRGYSLDETITFEGFSKDSVLIDGVFSTHSATGAPTTMEISGAKLTYPDGTSASWDGMFTFMYDDSGTPDTHEDDFKSITGSISGMTRDGLAFSAVITDPVIFKIACYGMRKIPVQGSVEINMGGNMSVIDYGDGTCDNNYTITTNGETMEYAFGAHHDDDTDEEAAGEDEAGEETGS